MNRLTLTRLILVSTMLSFGLLPVSAQEERSAEPEPETAADQSEAPAGYTPPSTSAFEGEKDGRNPFWPIGWEPTEEVVQEVKRERIPFVPSQHFKISSTLMGQVPLAIINGKSFAPGELVPIQFNGRDLLFKVEKVKDRAVVLSIKGKEFEVQKTSSF